MTISRPGKVFWRQEGITKGDLVEYYRQISPWLLHYLRDRPLVLDRYPDGIEGKSFYQKDAPEFIPEWIRTVAIRSEGVDRDINYLVCDDEESLLYIINLGAIPLHIWSSRVGSLDRPDWCILDLDPKEAPFANVVTIARETRALLRELELQSFVKTSGRSGLHVLLPLDGQATYEQSCLLGELIARVVEGRHPEIATTTRTLDAREGRVYIDYLQNRTGQLLAAPFSVRPHSGAPVSTPLRWREVNGRLDVTRFTIETVPRRLRRMKEEPLHRVLQVRSDLKKALTKLAASVG